MMRLSAILLSLCMLCVPAFSSGAVSPGAEAVVSQFRLDRLAADLKFLSGDLLEGRGTGTRGGDIAAAYIAAQFAIAGLKPMGDGGGFMQNVPLIGMKLESQRPLKVIPAKGQAFELAYLDEYVATALTLKEEERIDAPVVFAGYGITAPEYEWDDYAGIDVSGKLVVALVNDPPSQDPGFFGGPAMTYYGRWTYKQEEAARHNAAGLLLIHNAEMASYGWNVVRSSNSGERAFLPLEPGEEALPMAGWITEDAARKILAAGGLDLPQLLERAGQRGFHAVELPLQLQAQLTSKTRPLRSSNVIGLLEGSDPERKGEVIIYTAHYDHLGIGLPVNGDAIYNGAQDNASGTAVLLELARAYAGAPVRPRRSVVFLAVTAEEQGLRGSEYYVKNPAVPLDQTLLNLNYDGLYAWGEAADVNLTGAERTTVWPIIREVLGQMDLSPSPDLNPGAGYYYRSDHFNFARNGVPAFSVDPGSQVRGKSKEFAVQTEKEYRSKKYHQPSDEFDASWDLKGFAQLAHFGIYVGWRVMELPGIPRFNPGDEFARR